VRLGSSITQACTEAGAESGSSAGRAIIYEAACWACVAAGDGWRGSWQQQQVPVEIERRLCIVRDGVGGLVRTSKLLEERLERLEGLGDRVVALEKTALHRVVLGEVDVIGLLDRVVALEKQALAVARIRLQERAELHGVMRVELRAERAELDGVRARLDRRARK